VAKPEAAIKAPEEVLAPLPGSEKVVEVPKATEPVKAVEAAPVKVPEIVVKVEVATPEAVKEEVKESIAPIPTEQI